MKEERGISTMTYITYKPKTHLNLSYYIPFAIISAQRELKRIEI